MGHWLCHYLFNLTCVLYIKQCTGALEHTDKRCSKLIVCGNLFIKKATTLFKHNKFQSFLL